MATEVRWVFSGDDKTSRLMGKAVAEAIKKEWPHVRVIITDPDSHSRCVVAVSNDRPEDNLGKMLAPFVAGVVTTLWLMLAKFGEVPDLKGTANAVGDLPIQG